MPRLPYGPKFKLRPGLDPMVRFAFEEMLAQKCTLRTMSERTGIHRHALYRWLRGSQPSIGNLTAVLNVLGFELRPVERLD